MREVNGSELLAGSDHEFVVNLYTVVLNRWPDEEGYRHHLEKVESRPDLRRQMIRDVANSAEGKALGVVVRFDDEDAAAPAAAPVPEAAPAPAAPAPAPVAMAAAPAGGDLAAALARLKEGLGAMAPGELAAAERLLAETLAAVTTHRMERLETLLARLEQRLAG